MERISTHQFFILGSAVALGTTFFPVSSVTTLTAGRDGWMSVIPGFLVGIPFGLILISLARKYPNKNLFEISEIVLGKGLGKVFGILTILVGAYFGGLLMGQGADMFSRSILPEIPRWVFLLIGFFFIYIMVHVGIEVFARFSEIVFPIIVFTLILNALLAYPRFERGELLPLFENGFKPVFLGTLQIVPWPLEYILFLTGFISFLPRGKQEIKLMRSQIWRILLLSGFLDMIITLVEIWVFGSTEVARMTYGLLALGKMIEVSRTIAGVESIFMIVWCGSVIIKVCAYQFIVFWGIQSVIKLKKRTSLIISSVMITSVPLMFIRGSNLVVEITLADRYLILPFTAGWVLLIWGVNTWKQRKKASPNGG